MAYDFIVLGATGQQGRIVSRDLLFNGYSVLLCGRDKSKVEKLLKEHARAAFEFVDLRDEALTLSVLKKSGANVAINCAEGDYNLSTMVAAGKAGLHYLDLGSDHQMTEDQFKLHEEFKKKGLTVITGCGSTPGVVSVMARYAENQFDTIDTINVGFAWNANKPVFVVPFSVESITEEFEDEANMLIDGKFEWRKPKSNTEDFEYMEIGKQRTFYTRHPEPTTFAKYFAPKGIKNAVVYSSFPDHSRQVLEMFGELGLDSAKPVKINDVEIKPVNVLTQVLKKIEMPEGYTEKEDLWMEMKGEKDGEAREVAMDCIAGSIKGWEDATCNIDTGMPCSIMAQFIKTGVIKERGVFAPEFVVPPEPFFKELARRHMAVYLNGQKIN